MTVQTIRNRFLQYLRESGTPLRTLTPAQAIERVIEFYEKYRVAHCHLDEDGDMLLNQWGLYDWGEGDGEHFEWNLTRQILTAAGDGDEEIAQLSLTFQYAQESALKSLGEGEMECDDPDEVAEFRASVEKSKAFVAVCQRTPTAVTLSLEWE